MTLVSAPAGYGKTTLVASWLAQLNPTDAAYGWLSLDEYDNDPVRFLRYFLAAWQQIDETIGQSATLSVMRGGPPPPPETILTMLINDLAARTTTALLVLDDYHLITQPDLHHALTFWLEHAPPQVHLVIISRTKPPLSLPRLRVRRQLLELTAAELQFTEAEATTFLNQVMQLDLTPADITHLEKKTEGWIAGLQLAALSLQGMADSSHFVSQFAGSDHQVTTYLLEEVWQQRSTIEQNFLLQTSILPRLSAPLCDAVTGQTNGRFLLESLNRHNLFLIPIDNQHNWYRYHPIFAQFLQTRLQQQTLEQITPLRQRAGHWFATHNFEEEAIEQFLAAKAYQEAATLMATHAHPLLWQQGRPHTLLRWGEQLPSSLLYATPHLALPYGWTYVFIGQFEQLSTLLNGLTQTWQQMDTPIPDQYYGEWATLQGELTLQKEGASQALAWFAQAEKTLPSTDKEVRGKARQVQGYAYRIQGEITLAEAALQEAWAIGRLSGNQALQVFAANDLAMTYWLAARLAQAKQTYETLLAEIPAAQHTSLAALDLIYIGLGQLAWEANRLTEAQAYLEQALALCQMTAPWGPVSRVAYTTMAQIKQAQGDWKTAQTWLERAMESARQGQALTSLVYTGMQVTRCYLWQGEVTKAASWVQLHLQMESTGRPRYQYHRAQVLYGRYLWLQSQLAKAETLLFACRTEAETYGWLRSLVEINNLLALIHQTKQQPEPALHYLEPALNTAVNAPFIRIFVNEGAPMAQLLRQALSAGLLPAYVGQLQAAFMPAVVTTQPLLDPLTKRELEVLQLVANGLSNPEIANQLILATGTVAKYTNNIFSKLGVRNRTEAANRAKTLGILGGD